MDKKIIFTIDENVDYPVVFFLRKMGYDVVSIAESSPSLDDTSILRHAAKENRIIITCDKDFGTLVFRERIPAAGIILLRLQDQSSNVKITVLEKLLLKYSEKLNGSFTVVTENKIRIRKLGVNPT